MSADRLSLPCPLKGKTTYEVLEQFYCKLNGPTIPEDYTKYCLSVGDIVVLSDTPDDSWITPGAYFCDSVGFVRLGPEIASAFEGGEQGAEKVHAD